MRTRSLFYPGCYSCADRLIHTRKAVVSIRPAGGDPRTTEVAKPEGEDVGPLWTGQAKVRAGGAIRLLRMLGPGLVTGASDDDPSGIGTYSQVGAQFGYGLLWTMLISYPLMAAIQEISARIGRVTGCGIAANLRKSYPKPLLYAVLVAVAVANMFNLGADLGAMGDALHLLVPGEVSVFVVGFGAASLVAILFVPYSTYVKYLKWLTLSLFAYVGVILFVHVSWGDVARATVIPHVRLTKEFLTALAAALGTTISPYLFFWQASQEVEEVRNNRGEKPLRRGPEQADAQLGRIRVDTYLGMAFSNLVAFFIILTAASTLHAHGISQISTSADAATALKPLAGRFAFRGLCLRYRGNRTPCRSRLSSFRRIRHWRSLPVERKPRTDAKTGGAVLRSYLRGHNPRAVAELPAHRPCESSFLGRRCKWAGFGPVNGGHYDYRVQPKGDGKVRDSAVSQVCGMDRDGCHVLRGCRRISDLEIALGSLNSNCSSNAGRPRRSAVASPQTQVTCPSRLQLRTTARPFVRLSVRTLNLTQIGRSAVKRRTVNLPSLLCNTSSPTS